MENTEDKQQDFYETIQDASQAALMLGITSAADYKARYEQDPKLPEAPDGTYKADWEASGGWSGLLGKEPARLTLDKQQDQGKKIRDAHISVPLTKVYGQESIEEDLDTRIQTIRTLNIDEVAAMLKGDEFIVVDPIASETFIYDYDLEGHFEKEQVFLADDVIPTLEKWSESKLIVNRTFNEKPCGYSYCGWDEQPEAVKQQAIALGLR